MPAISQLPFPRERLHPRHLKRHANPLAIFPPELQAEAKKHIYLREYLRALPVDVIGVPQYYAEVSRKLKKLSRRNLIYPVGKQGIYIHLYPDPLAERDQYVAIEPSLLVELDDLMRQVDIKLLEWAEVIGQAPEEKRPDEFLKALDCVCTLRPGPNNGQLHVTPLEHAAIRYQTLRDKIGLGALEPLIQDSQIEDISCSGVGSIFIEHKIFGSLQTSVVFPELDDLDDFVVWLGERIKRPVTLRRPIVDAVLPDGSRVNIVYGRDIAKRGSNFTIRKFADDPLSIISLLGFGSMDYDMAAYLWLVIEEGLNVFVVGPTASGKTTLLNALTTFILPDAKVVSIEDTPELQVPHKNWIREVVREMGQSERGASVGMFDLLRAALRQRPDRIMIGEIRGLEGNIAFQAMQTGHGVMATFHAASVQKLIQRLTGDPINVPKPNIDNLDVVVIQMAVRGPDGSTVRRVVSINEIVDYDPVSNSFSFNTSFRWRSDSDTFEFPGDKNSYVLEEKIARKRGLGESEKRGIYAELRKRARILERLHKRTKVDGFAKLFQILVEAQKQGLI